MPTPLAPKDLLLFGGALATAGLSPVALGQVTTAAFEVEGYTSLNAFDYDGYDLVDLGNRSFADSGGFEILPYNRFAFGGNLSNAYADTASAGVEADATLSGGEFTFDTSLVSDAFFAFTTGGNSFAAASTTFTVLGNSDFAVTGEGDLTGGDWFVRLTDSSDTVVFEATPTVAGAADPFSGMGTLSAGDYSFTVMTATSDATFGEVAFLDATLTVVPTPATVTLMGCLGTLAARRRR
ncbi:MAG: hypothetical protein AAGI53_15945 [Planctomycetota bacterium]